MKHSHDDDEHDGMGFELAMFVFALLFTAIALFVVHGDQHVARVRFIDPAQPIAGDITTGAIDAELRGRASAARLCAAAVGQTAQLGALTRC